MTWTAPRTWAALEEMTAALFNTHIRDNLLALTTWESYTPTLSNWTLGNGSLEGFVIDTGGLVMFQIEYIVGSTDTPSGSFAASLPVTAESPVQMPLGTAVLWDDSTVANRQVGIARLQAGSSGQNLTVMDAPSGSTVTDSSPFTWATGDQINIYGQYRA